MELDTQAENSRLQQQLAELWQQARSNEEKMRRLQAQELRLLQMETLHGLLDDLLVHYPQNFHLDNVTLTLLDPEYEIQRLLEAEGVAVPNGLKLLQQRAPLDEYYGREPAIEMGRYLEECHSDWFRGLDAAPSCVAMLPLLRRGQLMGSLNLASNTPERFSRDQGTDFLERMASIVAISLENILNRERLKRIGLTDALTGLNNRRFFDQRLGEETMRSLRYDAPLSALFIDADHFKAINDRYGHAVGDRVLMELAKCLRRYVRLQDVLARFGGEEFAILLCGSLAEATGVARRIREEVEQMRVAGPAAEAVGITVSIGIAELHGVAGHLRDVAAIGQTLLGRADEALYAAKHQGRNRIMVVGSDGSIAQA